MTQENGSLRSQSVALQGPDLDAELTFQLRAGRMLRKRARAKIEGEAMLAGLSVECIEARGVFDSTFYFKVAGRPSVVVAFSRDLEEWQRAMDKAKGL